MGQKEASDVPNDLKKKLKKLKKIVLIWSKNVSRLRVFRLKKTHLVKAFFNMS